MEKLNKILQNLDQKKISVESAQKQVIGLFKPHHNTINIIKQISESPYIIDESTVPKLGVDSAPNQVVGNLCLSYVKHKQLSDIAEYYKNKSE